MKELSLVVDGADMEKRLNRTVIAPEMPVSQCIAQLDRAGTGALLLGGVNRSLVGILTDGDIRRAILKGISMEEPCKTIASLDPTTLQLPASDKNALELMDRHDIHHLPVVDCSRRIKALLLRKDLTVDGENASAEQRVVASIIEGSVPITEAMMRLDKAGTGVLLVCGLNRRLEGLITDGDFRRAILQRKPLSEPCGTIAESQPITAISPIAEVEALRLMNAHDISHLPILDADGCVEDLLLRKDIVPANAKALSAVIMAGGYGTRLLPLTEKIPKPMLPVGDRPLLELTIAQLRRAGVREVNLTTHYLPEAISEHFGNGETFGVRLNYLREEQPLGTAGGLKLVKDFDGTLLVINGDVLTNAPFDAMLEFHRSYHADLTIAVRKYDVHVPFGVVDCADAHVTGLQEKPSFSFFINAGAYLLEPDACEFIPDGQRFDMPELIQRMIEAGKIIVSFPITEYWLDMGRHEDYARAQEDYQKGAI